MSEWREYDFPPDRHRVSRHADLDFDGDGQAPSTSRPFTIERRARYVRPGRSLGARLWAGYGTVIWTLAKLIVAVIVGAFTFAAIGLMIMLLQL
jgi:hypothetical protein